MVANKPDFAMLESLEDFKREMDRVRDRKLVECNDIVNRCRSNLRKETWRVQRNLLILLGLNAIGVVVNLILWLWR